METIPVAFQVIILEYVQNYSYWYESRPYVIYIYMTQFSWAPHLPPAMVKGLYSILR